MTSDSSAGGDFESAPPASGEPLALPDLVRELVRVLSDDSLTVEDVTAFVGPVNLDPGVPMPMELQPTLDGVRSARLARYPDLGTPYVLTVEPDPQARLTPAALTRTLGDYRRALTHRGRPAELVFSPPGEGSLWRVVVIAQVQSPSGDFETAPITSIVFRRDPVSTTPES